MKHLRFLLLFICVAFAVTAQTPPKDPAQAEQDDLRQALGDAGNSPVDFVRALENHLKKYPGSSHRDELERALVKTAADLKDDGRVIEYGERVLQRTPDDAQMLERVATALLRRGDKASAERALKYCEKFKDIIQGAVNDKANNGREEAKLKDGADRANARALVMLARAEGILGHFEKASDYAELSFAAYPSVEAAREASRWLTSQGKTEPAIRYLAKAFTISELKAAEGDVNRDRVQLGELYKKWKGTETGLGDLILQSYDQTSAMFAARHNTLRQLDPNSGAQDPMQFTLSGLQGEKLPLASLKGKVVVMDFWATWCGPCRIQHPLYEKVKEKFKDRDDVVFLAVDTDEDHAVVKPFLEQIKWSQKVYFEDGLAHLLQVNSIPTTLIFDKKGEVASRMNGFLPERFVDMLAERIQDALKEAPKPAVAANPAP